MFFGGSLIVSRYKYCAKLYSLPDPFEVRLKFAINVSFQLAGTDFVFLLHRREHRLRRGRAVLGDCRTGGESGRRGQRDRLHPWLPARVQHRGWRKGRAPVRCLEATPEGSPRPAGPAAFSSASVLRGSGAPRPLSEAPSAGGQLLRVPRFLPSVGAGRGRRLGQPHGRSSPGPEPTSFPLACRAGRRAGRYRQGTTAPGSRATRGLSRGILFAGFFNSV